MEGRAGEFGALLPGLWSPIQARLAPAGTPAPAPGFSAPCREVESLLRLGADPNLVLPDGVAAVHLAAGSERENGLQCLAVLLQHGADPNARSEDALTPVHVAASWGCYKCLELLLREGGDPELQDQDGKRALELALEQGNEACVEILREHAGSEEAPLGPALCRGEDQGKDFSALNRDDLDTSIWGLSDVAFSPMPPGSLVRHHLEGSEAESEALEAGYTLPSQTLPAHPKPDFSFPAPFFPQPTSSPSPTPKLGPVAHLPLDDISPDHSCLFHPGPDYSCEDQDETVPSSLLADTSSSSSDSFFTAVEAFGPDAQVPNAVPSSPITPDATGATISAQEGWEWVPAKQHGRDQPHPTSALGHVFPRYWFWVFPLEPQDVTTRTPCKVQGLVSHNGEGNSSFLSDESVERGPPLKTLPRRCGPGSVNNESPREGKYLTLDSLEEARAVPLTTQTGNLVVFTEDAPFSEFLTDDKTSQSSEDEAIMWLTEDGEDEEDHIPQGLRASSCWNSGRKPLEPPMVRPILHPQLLPVEQSLQTSGPKPTEPLHTDPKAGPSFLDQHLLHAEDTVTDGQCSHHPSTPFPSRDPSTLSNQELLQHLQAFGESPGPVTPFTRQYYLKRLKEGSPGGPAAPAGCSPELSQALQTGCVPNAQDDEDVLAQQFDQPGPTQRWRGGIVKSSFTYLLLDPRVTQNLPSRCHTLSPAECFQTFTHAIFYVGKGTRTRPYSHLSEALRHQRNRQTQTCPKVQRILDIWAGGRGVVSLHCFQNVIAVEAYTREACLVDALGMQVLSNQKKGHCYGVVASWPPHRRRRLGVHLLHRALSIFLAEGERQLRPSDIQVGI
ncbi:ankyrin repeat and LEM domain-containing protein 1 [Phascolarctos cinereus]